MPLSSEDRKEVIEIVQPVLDTAAEKMSADVKAVLGDWQKDTLAKAVAELTPTAPETPEPAPSPEPAPAPEVDLSPEGLRKRAAELRKAKITEGLDLNDPEAVEAAAAALEADSTPEITRPASNVAPAAQPLAKSGGFDVDEAVKAMLSFHTTKAH